MRKIRWGLLCFVIVALGLGCAPARQDDSSDHYKKGVDLYKQGRYEKAIEAFKQAIRLNPDDADVYHVLGLVYAGLGRWQEAMESYKQALRLNPDDAEAHNNLGMAYFNLGRHQEAIEAFRQVIRLQPDHANAHNNLGAAYNSLSRHQEAIEPLQQAIRLKPNHINAHYNLGVAYLATGDKTSAAEIWGTLKNLDQEKANELSNLIDQSDQTPEQPQRAVTPLSLVKQWAKLKGGYFMAVSKEAYDKAWGLLEARDKEALNKMLFSGAIMYTVEGTEVYVENTHDWGETVEVRPRGDTHIYWVYDAALSPLDSTSPNEPVVSQRETNNNAYKLDGILAENDGRFVVSVSQRGITSLIKVGAHLCGGEIIAAYSPGDPDGITPDQSGDRFEYRIKMRFPDGEKVLKSGDVICDGSEDIPQQMSGPGMRSNANDSGAVPGHPHPPAVNKDAPGMDQVRNAQESFRKAQEAEQQGLYKRASFFYERAVEHAQWSLAYVIEGKRDGMKAIIEEGEQKRKDLSGKEDRDASAAESALVRDTDVRPAGALIFGLDTPREIMNWLHRNIKYKTEKKGFGDRSDRWQTPEETIAAGGGDCEDNAFLAQALLKGIGIDSYVIEVRWGFTDIHSHAICVFSRKNPKDYFDNDQLITSNNNIMKTLFRTYPKWQKIYILDFKTRTGNLILERKLWTYERMGGEKNELLIKDFLGEEG